MSISAVHYTHSGLLTMTYFQVDDADSRFHTDAYPRLCKFGECYLLLGKVSYLILNLGGETKITSSESCRRTH